MVQLVERRERLSGFAVYHMDGFWDRDGQQMVEAIRRAVGGRVKMRGFPWFVVPLAAPFVTFMRELKEMRYLWREPIRMSNERLVAELGFEPRTPVDEAVRMTLSSLGCLEEQKAGEVAGAVAPRG
jgi:nucleoside-diphosphate-sugar epimerase